MESFDDLSHNKGKGIIILAVGEAGTGKTSTAEVLQSFIKNHFTFYKSMNLVLI
jgi:ABC-type Na+ transport system ATPase subunit NatA